MTIQELVEAGLITRNQEGCKLHFELVPELLADGIIFGWIDHLMESFVEGKVQNLKTKALSRADQNSFYLSKLEEARIDANRSEWLSLYEVTNGNFKNYHQSLLSRIVFPEKEVGYFLERKGKIPRIIQDHSGFGLFRQMELIKKLSAEVESTKIEPLLQPASDVTLGLIPYKGDKIDLIRIFFSMFQLGLIEPANKEKWMAEIAKFFGVEIPKYSNNLRNIKIASPDKNSQIFERLKEAILEYSRKD